MNAFKDSIKSKCKTLLMGALLITSSFAVADNYINIQHSADLGEVNQIVPFTENNDPILSAYAFYQLSQAYLTKQDTENAHIAANKAHSLLADYVEENPQSIEGHSLYSILLGYQIGLDFSNAMEFGPKSSLHADKALQLQADHPMALMAKGIQLHFTPAIFGGSNKEANKLLSQAIAIYNNDNVANWGLAEAYMWRGTVLQDMGATPKAKADAIRALELTPNDFMANQLFATTGND